MGSEDNIEMREFFDKLFAVPLSDAATDGNNAFSKRRANANLDVLHRGDLAVKAYVSSFANAACHEDDDISFFDRFNLQGAKTFKHTRDSFRVVFVHLAPESVDAKS